MALELSMGLNFRFKGYTRRVARSLVRAMAPQWPEFNVDFTDELLDQVEEMVRNYPAGIQVGVLAGLYSLEFGSPLFGPGWKPLSWVETKAAIERLEGINNHSLPQIRMLVMLMKIMVSFSAYSRPDVEEFLGYRRREWRDARVKFRDILMAADPKDLPETPALLADAQVFKPADYLEPQA